MCVWSLGQLLCCAGKCSVLFQVCAGSSTYDPLALAGHWRACHYPESALSVWRVHSATSSVAVGGGRGVVSPPALAAIKSFKDFRLRRGQTDWLSLVCRGFAARADSVRCAQLLVRSFAAMSSPVLDRARLSHYHTDRESCSGRCCCSASHLQTAVRIFRQN